MTERKTISAVRNTVTLKRENPATAGVSECQRHSCYYNALLQRMQGAIDRSNTAKLEGPCSSPPPFFVFLLNH